MFNRKITLIAVLTLGVSSGAAFAQMGTPSGFYADPVMADPPKTVAHAYRASEATAEVAVVSPAVGAPVRQHASACTALNPCAAAPRAAHS